jgi:hypothetical protein
MHLPAATPPLGVATDINDFYEESDGSSLTNHNNVNGGEFDSPTLPKPLHLRPASTGPGMSRADSVLDLTSETPPLADAVPPRDWNNATPLTGAPRPFSFAVHIPVKRLLAEQEQHDLGGDMDDQRWDSPTERAPNGSEWNLGVYANGYNYANHVRFAPERGRS